MNWLKIIENFREDGLFLPLSGFLAQELNKEKIIYPSEDNWFRAFELTPFDKVKVVIIGQDPYHGVGNIPYPPPSRGMKIVPQADGLAFSTPTNKLPPSLKNIYKELSTDLKIDVPTHGDLTKWAERGVLLLNTVLTVEQSRPGSHTDKGWENFTHMMVDKLVMNRENLVFILLGTRAQEMEDVITVREDSHLVLKAPHPSPLSAKKGFFGSKIFSKANRYLAKNDINPIDWSL